MRMSDRLRQNEWMAKAIEQTKQTNWKHCGYINLICIIQSNQQMKFQSIAEIDFNWIWLDLMNADWLIDAATVFRNMITVISYMEWEQDISMFDWFFTPNNTSSKVIAITIGTIKYCYNNMFMNY